MITYDLNESDSNCEIILSLQPRTSGGGGVSREEVMGLAAKDMEARLPPVFDPDDVYLRYPTDYNECLNTTLVQEVTKFTRLEKVMVSTLASLQLALKGLVVLSSELEAMGNAVRSRRPTRRASRRETRYVTHRCMTARCPHRGWARATRRSNPSRYGTPIYCGG